VTAAGRLAGQVALVTGGGRGIGRAVALAMAAEGAAVVLAARTAKEIEQVAGEIGALALAVPADVRDAAQVEALVARALDAHGQIDVLVTAAGVASFGPVVDSSPEAWDAMVAVNLRGAYLCCRAALPSMIDRRRGTVVNVGSVVTTRTLPGSAAYTASKYGLLGFSRVLAEEARPHGVRVGVITAGAVDTPLWDAIEAPPERGRMLRPDQVAEAAVLMAAAGPNATVEEVRILPAGGIL
jgi:NAD(P)-dependent dehydrogenase (short-subunit alcohol dehydrogenase family)